MTIAIEGGVCAGKSTICHLFRDEGWAVFNEMHVKAEDEETFYKSQSPEHLTKCFVDYEIKKARDARRTRNAILDRSLHSVFALIYAKIKQAGRGLPDYAEGLRSEIAPAEWPDQVFFINIDDAERFSRYQKRGVNVDPMLLDPVFNEFFLEYFQSIERSAFHILDGNRPSHDLFTEMREILDAATNTKTNFSLA